MPNPSLPPPTWPRTAAAWAGAAVAAIGLAGGAGAALGMPGAASLVPGWPQMAGFSALGFLAAGSGLWCAARGQTGSRGPVVRGLGVVVGGLGVAAAIALAVGVDHPADQLHWWMSPAGAIGAILAGAALVLAPGRGAMAAFQALVLGVGLIGWLGTSHYLFGGEVLLLFGAMSLPTALAYLLLCAGLLCVRTDGGLMAEVISPDAGGQLARRLLPYVILAPALLGWIRLQGQLSGLYGTEFGLSLFVLANVAVFLALVWVTAAQLNRSDRGRRQADDHRRVLAAIVASSGDAIISKNLDGVITSWNSGAEKLFGYSAAEAVGQPLLMLFPPERHEEEPRIIARIARGEIIDHFETVRIAKDGRRLEVSVTISPIRDAGGRVVGASKIARDIGERLRAQRRLAQQTILLGRTQELARLGSIEVDHTVTPWKRTWSAETYRLLGLDPDATEPGPEAMRAALHPDDRPLFDARMAAIGRGEQPADVDLRVVGGGQERIVHVISEVAVDAQGRPLRTLNTLQDVSEARRAEGERREQAMLLAKSQQVAHLGSISKHFPTAPGAEAVRTWTEEACRLFGLEPGSAAPPHAELAGRIHPDDRAAVEAALAGLAAGRPTKEYRFRVRLPDGQTRVLHCISELETDPASGRPLRVFSTIQDVSDRVRDESRIREQLGRLDLLRRITTSIGQSQDLPSIFQAVVTSLEDNLPLDLAFCCTCAEGAAGLTVATIGQRSAAAAAAMALAVGDHLPLDGNGLTRCVSGVLVYEPELAAVDFALPRRLAAAGLHALVAVPLTVAGAVVAVVVVAQRRPQSFSSTDCEFLKQLGELVAVAAAQSRLHGELREAYDELRRNQQSMMEQERLRALGQMAGGIAHDINNAIAPAMIYSEWLAERELGLSEAGRRRLGTIARAIGDVAHTVARLREFYRRDDAPVPAGAVDLNETVAQVIDLTRARWSDMPQQRGVVVRLATDLAPALPAITAVASEVREALINLVFNAVDAMPEGGTLTLRTRVADAGVAVEVADTGVGMDEDTRRRCLEPFFTTKGERGTGLGLAMVYGIAERHGAAIDIISAPGAGTVMRLVFPLPVAAPALIAEPAAPAATRALRLLVIDDDPRLLASLAEFLELEGHRVEQATDGRAGIAAFNAGAEAGCAPDVVITDLGMPHLDGRTVAEQVKARSPATPVILLTGWGQRLIGPQVPPFVDRVLDKPPSLRDLRLALSQLAPAPDPP